jgi:hypothetical protein
MKYVVIAVVLVLARDASAQAFPPENQWYALECGKAPMTDRVGDAAGFLDDKDIVGPNDVAGMHAADGQFLYLRLRLDKDAAPSGVFTTGAWGFEFDLDNVASSYEFSILVDHTGAGQGDVVLLRNTLNGMPNNPADPAEMMVATHPVATHARTILAPSTYSNDPDFWLEFAMSWSELMPLTFNRNSRIRVWGGSSSIGTGLNGDLACHDGTTGAPTLDAIISDPTTPDPVVDTDGDGFTDAQEVAAGSDPNDPNSVPIAMLAGGGGCSTSGGDSLWLIGFLLCVRRRTSRSRS